MNSLFIWIPKTAGTSLFSQLEKDGMQIFLDYRKFENKGDVTFGHIDVKILLKLGVITKEYWQSCKPFAVVRNPYHRFVSLYHDFLNSGRIFPNISLDNFADILQNVRRKPCLQNTHHFSQAASQVDWLLPGVEIRRFEDVIQGMPHMNKSTQGDHMDYYYTSLKKKVAELYADDFAILNYDL